MTKQETIQQIYAHLYESRKHLIDENGWINNGNEADYLTMGDTKFLGGCDYRDNVFIRPKSLSGIENNNGWIKIESESDLPLNDNGEVLYESGKFISDGDFEQRGRRSSVKSLKYYFLQNLITHYRPIKILKPPIY